MEYLDLTLPTPAENLALDEALFDQCDESSGPEVLRFWTAENPFVVVGYANAVDREAYGGRCDAAGVLVLRRVSGGGTVLQAPGCLNYALIFRLDHHPALTGIPETNRFVMERHAAALTALLGKPVQWEGDTDLALGGRKFSGNSQRRRRATVLFHGTLLLDLDLRLVEQLLPFPSRQPGYRRQRSHSDFLVNLALPAGVVKAALRDAWSAHDPLNAVPMNRVARLVTEKYGNASWNRKF